MSSSINYKIEKYTTKLNSAQTSEQRDIYNQKLQYYIQLYQTGGWIFRKKSSDDILSDDLYKKQIKMSSISENVSKNLENIKRLMDDKGQLLGDLNFMVAKDPEISNRRTYNDIITISKNIDNTINNFKSTEYQQTVFTK
jgi:hypothetical protein